MLLFLQLLLTNALFSVFCTPAHLHTLSTSFSLVGVVIFTNLKSEKGNMKIN